MESKINSCIFPESSVLPELFLLETIVETTVPILFLCHDKKWQLYIVSRCYANAEKIIWFVQQTNKRDIINLLTNTITIREIFTTQNTINVISHKANNECLTQKVPLIQLESTLLPTPGQFLDAENEEFSELVSVLKNMSN